MIQKKSLWNSRRNSWNNWTKKMRKKFRRIPTGGHEGISGVRKIVVGISRETSTGCFTRKLEEGSFQTISERKIPEEIPGWTPRCILEGLMTKAKKEVLKEITEEVLIEVPEELVLEFPELQLEFLEKLPKKFPKDLPKINSVGTSWKNSWRSSYSLFNPWRKFWRNS